MNKNSSVRMTHEYAASEEAFERLTQIMCTEVSIPVSDRYNALYGEEDLHRSLILLATENRYAESGMRRLAIEASSARVPSGSWVRDTVSRLTEQEVTDKTGRALDSTLKELSRFGVFNVPVEGRRKIISKARNLTTTGWHSGLATRYSKSQDHG